MNKKDKKYNDEVISLNRNLTINETNLDLTYALNSLMARTNHDVFLKYIDSYESYRKQDVIDMYNTLREKTLLNQDIAGISDSKKKNIKL